MKNIGLFWIKFILVSMAVLFAINLAQMSPEVLGFKVPKMQDNLPLILGLTFLGVFFSKWLTGLFKLFVVMGMLTPTYFIMLKAGAVDLQIKLDPTLTWVLRGFALSLAGLTYAYGMMIIKSMAYKILFALFSPVRFVRKYIVPKIQRLWFKAKGVPPCPINKTLAEIDKFGKGDTYEKGRQFEEYIAQMYRVIGYNAKTTTQLRAEGKLPPSIQARGGSGEQGVDVIYNIYTPQGEAKKTIIQCKHYTSKVDNKAVQEIVAAMSLYEADHAVVITNSYFTKPAKELAEANGVTLIDRDRLAGVIERATKIYYQKYNARPKDEDVSKLVA